MKCVLTVAGLGTRLLPLTKEIPKEMMPIYSQSTDKRILLKPILQVIFETLLKLSFALSSLQSQYVRLYFSFSHQGPTFCIFSSKLAHS